MFMQVRFRYGVYMAMSDNDERVVLCGANSYDRKYYFNKDFSRLPESVQNDIHVICVLFTEEAGGIFRMEFDEDGNLDLVTDADEGDLMYDEVSAGLLIKEIQKNRQELFEQLTLFYKVVFLGEKIDL